MILNKVMMAFVGLSILSAPAAHSGFMDFAKRGFKSCTDNCKVSACSNIEKRAWCVKNCSYIKGDNFKIDMQQVCRNVDNYNPNKPLSAKEKEYIEYVKKYTGSEKIPYKPDNKPIDNQLVDHFNAIKNTPLD